MSVIYGYSINWIQKRAYLHKALGTENPADIFTKWTDRSILNMAMGKMNTHFVDGRSNVSLQPLWVQQQIHNDAIRRALISGRE